MSMLYAFNVYACQSECFSNCYVAIYWCDLLPNFLILNLWEIFGFYMKNENFGKADNALHSCIIWRPLRVLKSIVYVCVIIKSKFCWEKNLKTSHNSQKAAQLQWTKHKTDNAKTIFNEKYTLTRERTKYNQNKNLIRRKARYTKISNIWTAARQLHIFSPSA